MQWNKWSTISAGLILALSTSAHATFHLMQIEQVIGGVNGDPSAQAIQLRMRSPFQNFISGGKLIAYDANGLNPITVIDFATNVPIGSPGQRILIVSQNFACRLDTPIPADFIMTTPIPASYLAAGSLTLENDFQTFVVWRLSWGGLAYTGPTTGAIFNDADGQFGPPWSGLLPSTGLSALQFQGTAATPSVANASDYALTAGPSIWTNNAGLSATLSGVSACLADITPPGGNCTINIDDLVAILNAFGPCPAPPTNCPADITPPGGNGTVNIDDLVAVLNAFGPCLP